VITSFCEPGSSTRGARRRLPSYVYSEFYLFWTSEHMADWYWQVYQFMVQKDSKVNLQLAETTTTIAKESKKDSSTMKAIAVLTMCFLPGTRLVRNTR
jgi:dipeptidase